MQSQEFHEILIESFVSFIDYPVIINKKTGYSLKNGITILFKSPELNYESRIRLAKHYQKSGITD